MKATNANHPIPGNPFCEDCDVRDATKCEECRKRQSRFASAILSGDTDRALVEQAVDTLISDYRGTETYDNAMRNPLDSVSVMHLLNGSPKDNELRIAETYGDKTGALAAIRFTGSIPAHLVHGALVNLGHWEALSVGMDMDTGDIVAILCRKRFGYTIYLIAPDFIGWTESVSYSRYFYTEEEAVVMSENEAHRMFDCIWGKTGTGPVNGWFDHACVESDKFGLVHRECLPHGVSIGIKITVQ